MQLLTWTRLEKPVDTNGRNALKLVNFRNVKVLTERRYSSAKLRSNLNVWCVSVCVCVGGGGSLCPPPYKRL